jgi:nucleolar GTP-binding protein
MNGIIAQPRVTMKDKERAYNDNGVELGFSFNLQEHWRLKNPEHAVDIVPQIMNGKNIADFIDPDIEERLAALQKEEDILFAEWVEQRQQDSEDSGLDDEQIETLKAIRAHKYKAQTDRNMKNTKNGLTARVPRKFRGYELKEAERKLQNRGLETDKMREEVMTLGKRRWQGRRRRAEKAAAERNWPGHSDEEDNEGGQDPFAMDSRMDTMSNRQKKKAKAARSQSVARREKNNPHARGNSKTPGPAPRDVAGIGEADIYKVQKLSAIGRKGWQKGISARSGPGDRRLMTGLAGVKHLFTGKRGIGSTDRR